MLPTTRITAVFRSLAWFTYERLLGSLLLLTVVLAFTIALAVIVAVRMNTAELCDQ